MDTVNNVEIRKVFRDVRFPANSPWTATLDTDDLQDVRNQFAEFILSRREQQLATYLANKR